MDPKALNLASICEQFSTPEKARVFLEGILWANCPVCPHCKAMDACRLVSNPNSTHKVRDGLLKCRACRKKFTVMVGTIFSDSHIPLNKWLMAIFLLCSSKRAISAHQLHRSLGITYKSAWFMAHRLRYAMQSEPFAKMTGAVEVDETYVGGKVPKNGKRRAGRPGPDSDKVPVVSVVERDGTKRSMVMRRVTSGNLNAALVQHVEAGSKVVSEGFPAYRKIDGDHQHHSVNHSAGEYVRKEGDFTVHTNTVESSFSLLKRGIIGAFHHVSEGHLPRYLCEFDFRWNSRKMIDGERTILAIAGVVGKRLTYRDSSN